MSQPVWVVRIIEWMFPLRFVLARLTHLPFFGPLIQGWLFKGDDLIYLPRDRVVEVNQNIESPDEVVLPSTVVETFIRRAGHRWIMNECICRRAAHCDAYPIDLGCLFLGDAANGINPELGRPVSTAEALAHARRCRGAGLVHLIGRNKLDSVWLNVGPGTKLLTLCNCCPCCCIWRVLPVIGQGISRTVKRMEGVSVAVTDRCQDCGTCQEDVCFVQAISQGDGQARIADSCRGCGRCVEACPHGAIELTVKDATVVDEAVRRIAPLVDIS